MDAHRIARLRVAKVSAEEDFEDLSEAEQHELKQELEASGQSPAEADSRENLTSGLATDQEGRPTSKDGRSRARGWLWISY